MNSSNLQTSWFRRRCHVLPTSLLVNRPSDSYPRSGSDISPSDWRRPRPFGSSWCPIAATRWALSMLWWFQYLKRFLIDLKTTKKRSKQCKMHRNSGNLPLEHVRGTRDDQERQISTWTWTLIYPKVDPYWRTALEYRRAPGYMDLAILKEVEHIRICMKKNVFYLCAINEDPSKRKRTIR